MYCLKSRSVLDCLVPAPLHQLIYLLVASFGLGKPLASQQVIPDLLNNLYEYIHSHSYICIYTHVHTRVHAHVHAHTRTCTEHSNRIYI